MIIYVENPMESLKRPLEVTSELGKVSGYKSIVLLYTSNEQSEVNVKNTIYNSIRNIKH